MARSWQVYVGNIGNVHSSTSEFAATECFKEYTQLSKLNKGRAAGEQVALFCGNEIVMEYEGDHREYEDYNEPKI